MLGYQLAILVRLGSLGLALEFPRPLAIRLRLQLVAGPLVGQTQLFGLVSGAFLEDLHLLPIRLSEQLAPRPLGLAALLPVQLVGDLQLAQQAWVPQQLLAPRRPLLELVPR